MPPGPFITTLFDPAWRRHARLGPNPGPGAQAAGPEPGLQAEALGRVKQLSQAKVLEPYLTKRLTKVGAVVEVSMISTALVDADGKMYAIATTERAGEQGGK